MSLIDKIKDYIPSTRTLLKGTAVAIGIGLAMYAGASIAEARGIQFEIKGSQNPYQVLRKNGNKDQHKVYKFLGEQKKPNSKKTLAHCLGGRYEVTIDDSTNEVTEIKGKLPKWYKSSVNTAATATNQTRSNPATRTGKDTTTKTAQDNSYRIKVNYYNKEGKIRGSAFEVVPDGEVPEQGWNLEHRGDNFIFNKALNRFRVKYGENQRPEVKQFFGEKYLKNSKRKIFGLEGVVKKGKVGDNISIFLVKESLNAEKKPVKELEKYPISANNQAHTALKQDIKDYLSFASKEAKKAFKHQREEVLETLSNTSNIRVPTMGDLKNFLLGGSTPTTTNRNAGLPNANTINTYVGITTTPTPSLARVASTTSTRSVTSTIPTTASTTTTGVAAASAGATTYSTPVTIVSIASTTPTTASTTTTGVAAASAGATTYSTPVTIVSIASTTPTTASTTATGLAAASAGASARLTTNSTNVVGAIGYNTHTATPTPSPTVAPTRIPTPTATAIPTKTPTQRAFEGNEKTNKKTNQYDWDKTIKIDLEKKVVKFQVQGKPHSYTDGIFNSGKWGFKSFLGNQKKNTGYNLVKSLYQNKGTEIDAIERVNEKFTYQKKANVWKKVTTPAKTKVVIPKPAPKLRLKPTPKPTVAPTKIPTPTATPTPRATTDDSEFDDIFENPTPRIIRPIRITTPTPSGTPTSVTTATASGTVTASSTPTAKTWTGFDIPPSFIPLIPKHYSQIEKFSGSTRKDVIFKRNPTKITLTPRKTNIIITYDDGTKKTAKIPDNLLDEVKKLK